MANQRLLSPTCILLLLPFLCWSLRDDLYDYRVETLGGAITMWCNDSIQYSTAPNFSEPVSWMLPNLEVLYQTTGRFEIGNSNWTLTVSNITESDLGQYHCMLRFEDGSTSHADWYLARLGLNAQGPYFENLWDKYRLNTIIAISAGFGFLAIAVGMMLVYHFRYKIEEEESDLSKSSSSSVSSPYEKSAANDDLTGVAYTNKAFDGEKSSVKSRASSSSSSSASSKPRNQGSPPNENHDEEDEEGGTAF